MSIYFFQKGRQYKVRTLPEFPNQNLGVQNSYHMFTRGTIVTCVKVFPPNHPMNYKGKLIGEFVDENGVPQDLLPADVEVHNA